MGAVSRDQDTTAALHLIFTLAAMAESLADLREAQHRLHQARAARHAAGQLRAYRPPAGPTAAPDNGRTTGPATRAGPAIVGPAWAATVTAPVRFERCARWSYRPVTFRGRMGAGRLT
jgi:hypothetical protein